MAQVVDDAAAPAFTFAQLAYLEAQFGGGYKAKGSLTCVNDVVAIASAHSEAAGKRAVVEHIRMLIENQSAPRSPSTPILQTVSTPPMYRPAPPEQGPPPTINQD